MIFHFRAISAVEPAVHPHVILAPDRREQVTTVFALALAMLVVVAIAVLMGMA